ncbi:hydroxyacylglutathione hydrolase [Eionea flava]
MLHITAIPAFSDNYFWLLTQQPLVEHQPQTAYVIDPGDGEAVDRILSQYQLNLAGILVTHRHPDHTGGINFLTSRYKTSASSPLPVYGPDSRSIPQITHRRHENDIVTLFDNYPLHVMATPGHTPEHIVYYSETIQEVPVLFCGDTLFAGGCGRLLGGTAAQLHHSLRRLAALPDNTRVYCAHEYTLANLAFAQAVEPDNIAIRQRLSAIQKLRADNQSSIPFTLSEEYQTNPFLRVHTDSVKKAITDYWQTIAGDETLNSAEFFAVLRKWKDQFQ